MPGFDERLTRELERAVAPADPDGAFERIDRRRGRRSAMRRFQAAALSVVVLAGTAGGILVLSRAFQERDGLIGVPPAVRNGAVVVGRENPRGCSLWVVSPDGTERRLTDEPGVSDVSPAVSADGSKVAFARVDGDGRSTIWIIGFDGTGPHRLTEPSWGAIDPAWAPDGIQLAFAGDAGDGHGLYVMADLEGAAPHRVSDRALSAESDPAWSPDGSQIVFAAGEREVGVAAPVNFEIFVTPAEGGGPARNLTESLDAEVMPAWSPDGERIVFLRGSGPLDETPSPAIVTMFADGSDVRTLVGDGTVVGEPAWSPDGSLIAFDRADEGGISVFTVSPGVEGVARLIPDAFQAAWQPVLDDAPAPTASSAPTTAPGDDLGVGFPVCNVEALSGDYDGDGTTDTAYFATKRSDVGGCPQADGAINVLGVDITGDGRIDADHGPIECQLSCAPFLAIDLDLDGRDELLVTELGGAILGFGSYRLAPGGSSDGGPALVPIHVVAPGDPDAGFPADAPATFYLGGDEGFSATLDCRTPDTGRELIAATGQLDSIEQPTTWTIHRTVFRLDAEGWTVVDARTFDRPFADFPPDELDRSTGLCGHPFPPNPAFPL